MSVAPAPRWRQQLAAALAFGRQFATGRRWRLWAMLVLLLAVMLSTLVWLARGYEIDAVQRALDRENAEATQILRQALSRNLQDLHSLANTHGNDQDWPAAASRLLVEHREWLRLEWRDTDLRLSAEADSPFFTPLGEAGAAGVAAEVDILRACALARKQGAAAYAPSRFVPGPSGSGQEVMELCLPLMQGQQVRGYVVASYSLAGVLSSLLPTEVTRSQSMAFTELDGTRLAVQGAPRRGARTFVSQLVLDLPGSPLVVRMEGTRPAPDVFPNVLTALVTGLSVALVTVLVLLARDLRRRLQAEAEVADALAFRKAMENSLITGLRARDGQGRITYVNPAFCAMVGFEAQELIDSGLPAPYWPPEHTHEYGQRQAVRLAGQAPAREGVESVFMRKDGTRFPVLIFEAPLMSTTGKHTGWMSAVLDLTAQRRAEEQSRASQERLQASARLATVGEMASLMSHELNQPLAAISSYATGSLNLLPEQGDVHDADTLQDVRTALTRIAEQAGRAGRVINSVHDLVRRRGTSREAVTPHVLIDAVLPLVQLQARKLGITVHLRLAPELPALWCERTMIEQVLLNLTRNGMQAMAEVTGERELTLEVQAERAGTRVGASARVHFSIADSGEGISDAVAPQLFTPFFTTKAEGMGLGLSLCRTVVEQHGGALWYTSRSPRGTVFHFVLPAAGPGLTRGAPARPVVEDRAGAA
ncbi:MAG: PAS domain S-box protein [Proteobacteria bacterium]|nr:PAS domain S-box protein [Pseudomonadota bacterium]